MILAEAGADGGMTARMVLILLSAAFTDNILLSRFLGMCPFLSVSRQMKSAFGLGLAVVFVTTCTCGLNALLYWYGLVPLNRAFGVPLSLQLIVFIVVIAAFVQLMEMVIERISIGLYFSLGIFLPLITVNCAILAGSLFMVERDYNFGESVVFGVGSGVGWALAIMALAAVREKMKYSDCPAGLRGWEIR